MSLEMEKLRRLPLAEKLQLVEELWDDIAAADEPLVVRDWHIEEARKRAAELAARPDSAITREELWRRVNHPDG